VFLALVVGECTAVSEGRIATIFRVNDSGPFWLGSGWEPEAELLAYCWSVDQQSLIRFRKALGLMIMFGFMSWLL